LVEDAYTVMADNFAKLGEYRRAAKTYREILSRFKTTLSAAEARDYVNSAALYEALGVVPRQTVTFGPNLQLSAPNPGIGWKFLVEANNHKEELGVDSGANISLLSRSVAENLGVQMLNRSISMGSITSINVKVALGFLPMMKIGDVTVRNVVFIVMEDRDLTFPDGFVLKGVIGFPVLAGLRRITLSGDGAVSVSRTSVRRDETDMCVDGKNILFRGEHAKRNMTFMLDTGAERSILYVLFLHAFEAEITGMYSLQTEKFTGVGGSEEVPAYVLKNFDLSVAGHRARLSEIRLMTKALTDNGKYFYGNIGQDLIKRYKHVTLDFDSMRIAVE
jgi:predicted aspartyl protease